MSEVEKMYKNAGLSNMWVERYNDGYYEHERYYNSYKEMINNMMKANDWALTEAQEVAKRDCKKEHPPFTAKKQIEIVKWLLQNKRLCIRKAEYSTNFYMDVLSNRSDGVDNKDFEQCLASLMNNIWQALTEEERKQIKEILE